jgi:hypothetical protein
LSWLRWPLRHAAQLDTSGQQIIDEICLAVRPSARQEANQDDNSISNGAQNLSSLLTGKEAGNVPRIESRISCILEVVEPKKLMGLAKIKNLFAFVLQKDGIYLIKNVVNGNSSSSRRYDLGSSSHIVLELTFRRR